MDSSIGIDIDPVVSDRYIDVTTQTGEHAIYDKENTSAYIQSSELWDVKR